MVTSDDVISVSVDQSLVVWSMRLIGDVIQVCTVGMASPSNRSSSSDVMYLCAWFLSAIMVGVLCSDWLTAATCKHCPPRGSVPQTVVG